MRCLGIDYGEKRTGLAYGDELGLAVPLPAVLTADPAERLAHIGAVARERRAQLLVVGYPVHADGSPGPQARTVDAFITALTAHLPLPVRRMDEVLTSHAAEAAWKAGPNRRQPLRSVRASGTIDSHAAALILQDYLDQAMAADP
jgi:putative Holliday junction resolvase